MNKTPNTALEKARDLLKIHTPMVRAPYDYPVDQQGEAMANLLKTLGCNPQTQLAALLYPDYLHGALSNEVARSTFGANTEKLLADTQRMEVVQNVKRKRYQQQQTQYADNLRKMLLVMMRDMRVVLIKLAEQLTLLKHLKNAEPVQQQQVAEQVLLLYAPLANRLGIGQLKWQLEDLAFRYLDPEAYQNISKSLNMRRSERESLVQSMIKTLEKQLTENAIPHASITGRAKHIYSIHRKLQLKRKTLEEIYDTSALRIIVHNIEDCYKALSVVHSSWPPIQAEFDDYISKPKPNGYQSIHTAIIGPGEKNIEIQIRTQAMHEACELGVAAHWRYKEGDKKNNDDIYQNKITWLRQMMDWQQEITEEMSDAETQHQEGFNDRLYVFTPNGDIFDLPEGATPLDFAYRVHTEIGHRCKGAKVNQKLVPLTHALNTGDVVEILTQKSPQPSRDWLRLEAGYLTTSHARAKARQWFKRQHFETNLQAGEILWEKATRNTGIKKSQLDNVLLHFNVKKREDLLVAIGAGSLSASNIIQQIKGKPTEPPQISTAGRRQRQRPEKKNTSEFIIEGVGNLKTQLGRCCKPIPGDQVKGYITTGHGITIHQTHCPNLCQAIAYRPERVLSVEWNTEKTQHYSVDLLIDAEHRSGLIHDLSQRIMQESVTILALTSRLNTLENRLSIETTVEFKATQSLDELMHLLRGIEGIRRIERRR